MIDSILKIIHQIKSYENLNLMLGLCGTITGSLALIIQFLSHVSDRAKLHVTAVMWWGGNTLSPKNHYSIQVVLTNKGRRIVRIQSIKLRIRNPLLVATNRFLIERGYIKKFVQPDIGIYEAAVDPINEFQRRPDSRRYPPDRVDLEENQATKLTLQIDTAIAEMLPRPKAWLIVIDQIGKRYKAPFQPMPLQKEAEPTHVS